MKRFRTELILILTFTICCASLATLEAGWFCKRHPQSRWCHTPTPVPPIPTPTPVPPIPPIPIPTPSAGFRVMIVEVVADRGKLTTDQREILLSTAPGSVREWLTKNCVRDAKGNPDFRLFDQNEPLLKESPIWLAIAATPHDGLVTPYWIISTPIGNVATNLPATRDDAITALNAALPKGEARATCPNNRCSVKGGR